jgi:hypothetical protein
MKSHRPSPSSIIAGLALFFALSGTAIAAHHYLITSTSQIKPSVLATLHGARGANGANGSNGASGANGAQGPQGPTGAQGPGGPGGPQGPQGPGGPQGPAGPSNLSTLIEYESVAFFVPAGFEGEVEVNCPGGFDAVSGGVSSIKYGWIGGAREGGTITENVRSSSHKGWFGVVDNGRVFGVNMWVSVECAAEGHAIAATALRPPTRTGLMRLTGRSE